MLLETMDSQTVYAIEHNFMLSELSQMNDAILAKLADKVYETQVKLITEHNSSTKL